MSVSKSVPEQHCLVCGDLFKLQVKGQRMCSSSCVGEARRRGIIVPRRANPPHAWTDEEIGMIRAEYPELGPLGLSQKMGLDPWIVKAKARRMGIHYGKQRAWKPGEIEFLRNNYSKMSATAISKIIGKTTFQIRHKLRNLAIQSSAENGSLNAEKIADVFGVSRLKVAAWIENGWIDATNLDKRGVYGYYEIDPWSVRWFIREHPEEFDLARVNQLAFLSIAMGGLEGEYARSKLLDQMGHAASM